MPQRENVDQQEGRSSHPTAASEGDAGDTEQLQRGQTSMRLEL
eukprot:CAMPEP_0115753688 /NCGR_PEP_ID=MMETSP0272-20121206/96462_1 /TAXON_ID=71861 /ORGANISM="Scrippsiella trochoidea, Strain CCMP3099" /LENGTH=42 /DNA_ID= /DNA_START= /DNA_END= /DNA_ORIENTATION=